MKSKDGKVGQDNLNSVEHGPFFRLKASRDLPCVQALFLNFILGSSKVKKTKNKSVFLKQGIRIIKDLVIAVFCI